MEPGASDNLIDRLYQRECWASKDGRLTKLDEMAGPHRRNLIAWLERRAVKIHAAVIASMYLGPQPSGEMACDAFDSELARLESEDPLTWLRSTPLLKRLRKLEKKAAKAYAKRMKELNRPVVQVNGRVKLSVEALRERT